MSRRKGIILFLLLGLALRLFLVFGMPIRYIHSGEPEYFDHVAWNLAQGKGYTHQAETAFLPVMDRPPVYFLFVAAIYRLAGHNPLWIRMAQLAVDLGTCFLIFILAREIWGGRKALWALALVSFNPFLSVYTAALLPMTLTAFLLTLSVFFASKAAQKAHPLWSLGAGVSLGALALCRAENALIPVIFAAILLLRFRRRFLPKVALMGVGLVLFMAPWWIRNYEISGRFIPVAYGGATGRTLYFSSVQQVFENDATYFQMLPGELRGLWERTQSSNFEEVQQAERRFAQIGLQRIRENPVGYLLRRLANYPKLWIGIHPDEFVILETGKLRAFHPELPELLHTLRSEPREIALLGAKYFLLLFSIAYVALAVYGLWVSRQAASSELLFAKTVIFCYAVIFFPAVVEARYSIPVYPVLALFAAFAFLHRSQASVPLNVRGC